MTTPVFRYGTGADRTAEDRYPDARTIRDFHRNSDLDSSPQSQHHSLGPDTNQAAAGSHTHDGNQSRKINFSDLTISPVTVTGSRDANAALQSLLNQLASLGLIVNNTTV